MLSGDEDAVTALAARLGRRATRLRVSHAFHSPLLDPMLAEFRAVAESVTYHRPSVPVVSTLTGRPGPGRRSPPPTTGYGRRARRSASPTRWLAGAGGSDGVRRGRPVRRARASLAEECVAPDSARSSAHPPAPTGSSTALAALHVHGVPVDWQPVYAGSGARRRPLPTYPFQRQRYWLDAPSGRAPRATRCSARHSRTPTGPRSGTPVCSPPLASPGSPTT